MTHPASFLDTPLVEKRYEKQAYGFFGNLMNRFSPYILHIYSFYLRIN